MAPVRTLSPQPPQPQAEIPCLLMRGGTSRGPYFNAADLPAGQAQLAKALTAIMGAGSLLQVDGIGGGQPTTSKAAILSRSKHAWAEVDYLFAQVHAEKSEVDFAPTCGNILAGVGPAALEMGLVAAVADQTRVRIRSVNTGALTEALVETPHGRVNYAGDARIDGVPGTSAAVLLNFQQVEGAKTGALFPTGKPSDVFDGVTVTCIDAAMPMVIGRARDFGISGYEAAAELNDNAGLLEKIEAVRRVAGERMGLGDVAASVIPKFGLLAAPVAGGHIAARYFVPWKCHPSYAVTGAICTGACVLASATVADGIGRTAKSKQPLKIEHPAGAIEVVFDYDGGGELVLHSAGVLRTARKLFHGKVYAPADALSGVGVGPGV